MGDEREERGKQLRIHHTSIVNPLVPKIISGFSIGIPSKRSGVKSLMLSFLAPIPSGVWKSVKIEGEEIEATMEIEEEKEITAINVGTFVLDLIVAEHLAEGLKRAVEKIREGGE